MPLDPKLEALARIPDPFATATPSLVSPIDLTGTPPSPTRTQMRRVRRLAVVGALGYELAWVLVVERRPDLAHVPTETLALALLLPLLAALIAWSVVVRRGRDGFGPSIAYSVACVLLAPMFFAVSTWMIAPPDLEPNFAAWADHAVRCVAVTGLLTALPLALGGFALRRAFVSASAWKTAALGVACGALAAATMSLVCANGGALHVVIAHGAMMAIAGAIGALLGRYVARA